MAPRLRTYTYRQLAEEIFHCHVGTIRAWVSKEGLIKPIGYIKKGKWKRIALFDEESVKKLVLRKIIHPELFDGRMNKKSVR